LLEGSDVRYRGYRVGKVLRIIPGVEDTKIYMTIAGGIKVPVGSTLRVAFDGLIGQKFVEIVPSRSLKSVRPGSEIKGFSTLGLVDFIDVGTVNLEELRGILESVRKITDDPKTQSSVKEALINIEAATYELNKFVKDLNDLMDKDELEKAISGLSKTSEMVVDIGTRLDAITIALDDLLSDKEFGENIKGAAKGANEAMDEIKNAASDIRKTLRKLVR